MTDEYRAECRLAVELKDSGLTFMQVATELGYKSASTGRMRFYAGLSFLQDAKYLQIARADKICRLNMIGRL